MKTKFSVEITVEADNQKQAEKDLATWCRIKNSDSISVNETRFTRFELTAQNGILRGIRETA